jgi:hypothetical protein
MKAKANIYLTDRTVLHVDRLKIEGIDPSRVEIIVRKFFDIDMGDVFVAEHFPTGTEGPGRATAPEAFYGLIDKLGDH